MKIEINSYTQFLAIANQILQSYGDEVVTPNRDGDIWGNNTRWIAKGRLFQCHYLFENKRLRLNLLPEDIEVPSSNSNSDTWESLLKDTVKVFNEDYETIKCSLDLNELKVPLNDNLAFTAWTEEFVYFPVIHDNIARVICIPRNPNEIGVLIDIV